MREVSEAINPIILDSLDDVRFENIELHEFLKDISPFKKRVEKKEKLRPFFMRLVYNIVGSHESEEIDYACAAAELLNVSTYIFNAVFDGKGKPKTEQDINNHIIAGMLIRNKASEVLRKKQIGLEYLLEEIDRDVYIGQYADLNQIKYGKKCYKNMDDFLDDYIDRCYKFTGRFMENIAKIGAILGKASEEQIEILGEYGKNMGIVVQIVNDIGDFVPPIEGNYDVEKIYQDQFSDMKQGKLTLPVYYVLTYGSDEDKQILDKMMSNKHASNGELIEVTKVLVKSGAIDYAKKIAGRYAKKAKKCLNSFERCESRDYLDMMTEMWRTNKYLANLRKYR